MEESDTWVILTSKHDDSTNNRVAFVITSNLSLFPGFRKHCPLSLGQTPTDIFEDSSSSSEYLAI